MNYFLVCVPCLPGRTCARRKGSCRDETPLSVSQRVCNQELAALRCAGFAIETTRGKTNEARRSQSRSLLIQLSQLLFAAATRAPPGLGVKRRKSQAPQNQQRQSSRRERERERERAIRVSLKSWRRYHRPTAARAAAQRGRVPRVLMRRARVPVTATLAVKTPRQSKIKASVLNSRYRDSLTQFHSIASHAPSVFNFKVC